MRRGVGSSLALLLLASIAWAQPRQAPDPTAAARAHSQLGQGLYHLGDYAGAVREFKAGYEAAPRPEFLLNLGQSCRALGDLTAARDYYRRFLAESPSADGRRAAVETLLAAIDRQLAEQPPKPPPPAPAVAPPPRVEAHPPPAAPAVDRPREQPPRPWYRRPATWIVVAIVAAVIAGGAIALGLTIGRRPPQPNSGTIVVMP